MVVVDQKEIAMITTLSRTELYAEMTNGNGIVLVEALPTPYYRKVHLPGARNIPPDDVDAIAPRVLPDKSAPIVVYCMDRACPSSGEVAERLVSLGYRDVRHYREGKADWLAAGLPTERGRDDHHR